MNAGPWGKPAHPCTRAPHWYTVDQQNSSNFLKSGSVLGDPGGLRPVLADRGELGLSVAGGYLHYHLIFVSLIVWQAHHMGEFAFAAAAAAGVLPQLQIGLWLMFWDTVRAERTVG